MVDDLVGGRLAVDQLDADEAVDPPRGHGLRLGRGIGAGEGRHPRDDRHPAGGLVDGDPHDGLPLGGREVRHLAGGVRRGQAVHPLVEQVPDEAAQGPFVHPAAPVER